MQAKQSAITSTLATLFTIVGSPHLLLLIIFCYMAPLLVRILVLHLQPILAGILKAALDLPAHEKDHKLKYLVVLLEDASDFSYARAHVCHVFVPITMEQDKLISLGEIRLKGTQYRFNHPGPCKGKKEMSKIQTYNLKKGTKNTPITMRATIRSRVTIIPGVILQAYL